MPTDETISLQDSIERIEALALEAREISEPRARAVAVELAQAVMEFHRVAIGRALEIIAKSGEGCAEVLQGLAEDDLTSSLLLAHDLHPDSLQTRVERSVARLDDAFRSLGARVSFTGISADAVVIGFESSRVWPGPQTRSSIENLIFQAAPEIETVVIDGLIEEAPRDFVPLGELLAGSRP